MHRLEASVALGGRLLLAAIFVFEGWVKIDDDAGVVAYMESYGVPGALLPLAIVAELGGGMAVAIGFLTRLAALGLGSFAVLTALFFHSDFGDPEQVIHFGKNLAIAGGFMILLVHGPGSWSLDAWRPALLRRMRIHDSAAPPH
jgi:putative oxidoreductase